jgi:hypothetical protein
MAAVAEGDGGLDCVFPDGGGSFLPHAALEAMRVANTRTVDRFIVPFYADL